MCVYVEYIYIYFFYNNENAWPMYANTPKNN